jgi:hypothetical protein
VKTNARIAEDGFAELHVSSADAPVLLDMMKARVRRLCHLDQAGPSEFADVSRLSRVCFAITSEAADPYGFKRVQYLSYEDVDALYVMPVGEDLLKALNSVRFKARRSGPVDPVVADRMAKSVTSIMED